MNARTFRLRHSSYGGIWVTGRDQAARLCVASACATPSMTRGNWLVPLSLRHFFEAARTRVKIISLGLSRWISSRNE